MDIKNMTDLLVRAQETYGYSNQVTVATEELLELGAVLCKYPRYPDHTTADKQLRGDIVDEIADVVICLQHLYIMFNITEAEISDRMDKKLKRLERWLDSSSDAYQTTVDREVE